MSLSVESVSRGESLTSIQYAVFVHVTGVFLPLFCPHWPKISASSFSDDSLSESAAARSRLRAEALLFAPKKEAIIAAAGRALDCLRHRDSSCTYSSDRYCRESPYTVDDAPEVWKRVCQSARGVCGIDWPSLPPEDRLTTHSGVSDLHCLLVDKYDDEYWRTRYKVRRFAASKDI